MYSQTVDEHVAFRAALLENLAAVVDSLNTIGGELRGVHDEYPAEFFEQIAGIVRLFSAEWLSGQETLSATVANNSRRRPSEPHLTLL